MKKKEHDRFQPHAAAERFPISGDDVGEGGRPTRREPPERMDLMTLNRASPASRIVRRIPPERAP
jgi:hypothetical protein